MRTIEKVIRIKKIVAKDGRKIKLFYYEISGGDVVKTPQLFKVGDRVEAWFNEEYDEIRIRKYRGDKK